MTDDEVEGDLSDLRKACQKADLVVASWDDGKLLLKGAALLDDGQDHPLVGVDEDEGADEVDGLLLHMTDTTTGRKFTCVSLEVEDEEDAFELRHMVEGWGLAQ